MLCWGGDGTTDGCGCLGEEMPLVWVCEIEFSDEIKAERSRISTGQRSHRHRYCMMSIMRPMICVRGFAYSPGTCTQLCLNRNKTSMRMPNTFP